jgi:hypothetical protein
LPAEEIIMIPPPKNKRKAMMVARSIEVRSMGEIKYPRVRFVRLPEKKMFWMSMAWAEAGAKSKRINAARRDDAFFIALVFIV